MRVLALGTNYEPIGTISWKKAVALVFLDKVITLEQYDEEIHSPSFSMKIPSVIVMKNSKMRRINSVRFSRKNVWLRDEGLCQYCSKHVSVNSFTIDHVNPKFAGGKTTWDNVVVSCYECNQKKGEKTLKESGFKLLKVPRKPSSLPFVNEIVGFYNQNFLHPTWKFWLNRA
jgi:5-methylcytosine-specific restriction endonuclease McrA